MLIAVPQQTYTTFQEVVVSTNQMGFQSTVISMEHFQTPSNDIMLVIKWSLNGNNTCSSAFVSIGWYCYMAIVVQMLCHAHLMTSMMNIHHYSLETTNQHVSQRLSDWLGLL